MELRGNIRFTEAIVVDEKLLVQLENTLLEFYDDVLYSVKLCNGDLIKFNNLQEMLDYENIDERKIESLQIGFNIIDELNFYPTYSAFCSYKCTVSGTYRMDNSDKSILFSNKVNDALKKARRPQWYTVITKISMFHFLIVELIICFFLLGYIYIKEGELTEVSFTATYFISCMLSSIMIILLCGLFSKIRKYFFPSISYMIGEQIVKIEALNKLYGNIFWCVIVAFIVSVFSALVL